jgi:hypothetical protein
LARVTQVGKVVERENGSIEVYKTVQTFGVEETATCRDTGQSMQSIVKGRPVINE